MKERKYLIIIGGATAVGKTKVAIEIAKYLNSEIISCDSRQLYKEMNIGTAKPNDEELSQVKHYFINSHTIDENYNVGRFEKDSIEILKEIFKKNNFAVMVGGTGLYIDAVCNGIDKFPSVENGILNDIEERFKNEGLEYLQKEIKLKDPEYYSIVDNQNHRRLIRALSIIRSSGQTFSSFLTKNRAERNFTPIFIRLEMDRDKLYERINYRVDLMIKAGLEEEAKSLYHKKDLKSLQTVGYQEWFDYFEGKYDIDEAIRLIKRNTRRYAKRQITWFRKEKWKGFHNDQIEEILSYILKLTK